VSIPVGGALPTGAAPEQPGPDAVRTPGEAASSRTRRRLPQLGVGGWISVGIITVAVLLALFGPLVRPFDPNAVQLSYANVGPTGGHLLGFDGAGRDLLSRLMVGARTTLLGAALVSIVAVFIGSSLAVLTAWFGGRFDTAVSSGLDVMFAFPGILLAVLAAAVFGPGLFAAGLALAMAYSPYLARVLRGAALKERAMAYIQAGEVQGFSSWWLCFRHLLPNISALIVAQGTIFFGFAVVDLAALSFLGLGIQPPQADWGVMVSEGKTPLLQGYPLEALAAVICIVLVVSAVSFLGERLQARSTGSNR
jgi:peptide/nickel transport system permease protein